MLDAVSAVLGVPVDRILSPSRSAPIVRARQACMVLLREAGMSLPEVGKALGRHHSTVIHGLTRAAASPILEACRVAFRVRLTAQARRR